MAAREVTKLVSFGFFANTLFLQQCWPKPTQQALILQQHAVATAGEGSWLSTWLGRFERRGVLLPCTSSWMSRAASRKGFRFSTTESLYTRVANGGLHFVSSLLLKMSNDDAPDVRVKDRFPAGGWQMSTGMVVKLGCFSCALTEQAA